MTAPSIDLVVFDLGRVMVRLCKGWRHACERAGVAYRPEFDAPDVQAKILEHTYLSEVGRLDQAGFREAVSRITGLDPRHVDALTHVWLDGPFPGWDDLLDRLGAAGVRTACLSNTNAVHWAAMSEGEGPNRLPLERLTYRFASHLLGAFKPEPAIYRAVERETGVHPERILFFDDAPPNIDGARACGWHAERIDPAGDPAAQVGEALASYRVLRR